MVAAPIMAASAVRRIGLKRTAPASSTTVAQRFALSAAVTDEIDQQNRIANDDAGQRDESDHRGRGEGRAEQPVSDQNPDQRQRDRRQNDQWQPKAAELGHHQHVDAEDRRAERSAHVAEGHIGDLPFAVPEQRRVRLVGRLTMQA